MTTYKNIFQSALILLAVAAALLVAGCGGSSSGSGSSSSSGGSTTSEPSEGEPAESAGNGGGFKGPAKFTKFGKPASASELEAASKVLAENLEARESGDFAGQCASLSSSSQGEIVKAGELEGTTPGSNNPAKWAQECTKALEAEAMPLKATEQTRSDTLDAPIDELRVKGSEAWALYHGNDGNDWAMPLKEEEGTWKVASIVTTELE